MKLMEFTAIVVEAGDAVSLHRDNHRDTVIPATVEEARACGAWLYRKVRVTVESIDDEETK